MKKIIKIIAIVFFGYLAINLIPLRGCCGRNADNNMGKFEIIGHRGAAGLAPENSLLAIEKGIENGASLVEIDVHLSKDNEVIVCHDATTDRTTNGKGKIKDMTLRQLREHNIIDNDNRETELKLPTLNEVIDAVNGRVRILLEIKDGHKEGIEKRVVDIIESSGNTENIIIQSFKDDILEEVHKLNPNLRLEKLYVMKLLGLPLIIDNGISVFTADKYKHISSMNGYYKYLTPGQAKQIKAMGKEIRVYTVDSPKDLPTPLSPYINSIITDRPDLW